MFVLKNIKKRTFVTFDKIFKKFGSSIELLRNFIAKKKKIYKLKLNLLCMDYINTKQKRLQRFFFISISNRKKKSKLMRIKHS